ncbi:MAG: ribosomal protein [Patescibacteria group bacterium]|nr:ribosomal protein [Patescibacteria group bacterium]
MVKTKKDNLKGESKEDLKKKLVSLQSEVQVLKFKAQGAKSKNVKEESVLRKQIARILTELNKNK